MDFKLFACLLVLFGAAAGQDNPLPGVYDQVFYIYNQFQGFQDTARLTMGVLTGDLTSRVVGVLVSEIESWQRRLLLQCPVTFNTEAAGEILRSCSEAASMEISQLQDNVFDLVEAMNEISTEVSISMFRELTEFNIVLHYETFAAHFDPIIADYQAQLDEFVAEVGLRLGDFILTGDDLPERTSDCIGANFRKILESCM